jgi:lysophospholipid acyltransferase
MRPFFLSASPTQSPLPSKIYYDIFSWFITQAAFTFAVTPFVLLRIQPSYAAWSRVYFYAILGTVVSMAFFASPAKGYLLQRLRARMERPELLRTKSEGGGEHDVMLGLPVDAEAELQEIVAEVRAEIEKRKKEGIQVPDVRALVREKVGQAKAELERQGVNVEKMKKEL